MKVSIFGDLKEWITKKKWRYSNESTLVNWSSESRVIIYSEFTLLQTFSDSEHWNLSITVNEYSLYSEFTGDCFCSELKLLSITGRGWGHPCSSEILTCWRWGFQTSAGCVQSTSTTADFCGSKVSSMQKALQNSTPGFLCRLLLWRWPSWNREVSCECKSCPNSWG